MTKAPINLQDLRRRLYVKAKTEPTWRFWGLYGHVCKRETLQQAYRLAKANDGAPGIDGVTFEAVEAEGVERFLDQLHQELVQRTYRPQKARKVEIPKGGGVISPLLSNLYLNEVDRMLERAKAVTRHERWTGVEYARFADDLVILVNSHPRQQWLRQAVEKRLREELAKLLVEVNEEKSRKVDLQRGESFGFLGFEFRRVRSRRGRWMPLLLPKSKKRTALLSKLKEIFRKFRSQPVGQVIEKINPILRGWVKYFAIGHSSRCFSYIQNWVEMKIRRHLARACQRRGFGWKRWSREWLYDTLRLFSEYRVSYVPSFSAVVPN